MNTPRRVQIVEVGPRDGLQNESGVISLAAKIELVEALANAGLTTIEAGSFVNPRWVPQMADSEAVFAGIKRKSGVRYCALTPNLQGFERALAAGASEVAVFTVTTESFSQKNTNCSIAESLERFVAVTDAAKAHGIPVRGYVSCVLGCPYEGEVAPGQVARLSQQLLDMGCYEVSLGDTIGIGTPGSMARLLETMLQDIAPDKLAVHCHDTYGQALGNILIALQHGIATIDASVAGLGGCPFAPGASGNVATEDVVYMLQGMEIETGIDLDALIAAGRNISTVLHRGTASRVAMATLANCQD